MKYMLITTCIEILAEISKELKEKDPACVKFAEKVIEKIYHPTTRTTPGRVVVGIDPGTRTGLAIVENGKLKSLQTTTPWAAIVACMGLRQAEKVAYIEDAGLNPPIWDTFKAAHRSRAAFGKVAQNVGMNKGLARLMVEALEDIGFEVVRVAPSARRRRRGPVPTKVTAADFRKLTGLKRTSEHARDAYFLIAHEILEK